MPDLHKITDISVSTTSTNSLRGVVEIETQHSTIQFELDEDVAHRICTHLERFLTQQPQQKFNKAQSSR